MGKVTVTKQVGNTTTKTVFESVKDYMIGAGLAKPHVTRKDIPKHMNCRCSETPVNLKSISDCAFEEAEKERIELRNGINAEILERESENKGFKVAIARAKLMFSGAITADEAAKCSFMISGANENININIARIEELKEKLKTI